MLGRRFPDVTIALEAPDPAPRVLVAGGRLSLERMVLNVMQNACEGDGDRYPTMVHVAIEQPGPGWWHIAIEDDGPGFDAAALDGGVSRGRTTKPDGSCLGLPLTEGIAEASGGRLELGNRPGGGARVVLALRGA